MTFLAPSHGRILVSLVICSAFSVSIAQTPANVAAPSRPATEVIAAASSLFDYDPTVPLEVLESEKKTQGDAVIRDLTFAGSKNRITAYLVSPVSESESYAAILYVHWLGERETTNRTEFLNEAIALASQGVVSLLIDAMWAEPKWYEKRIPEEDYEHAITQVIDLRRSLDLLLSQPGVDSDRVAFVGHDFGAMYGIVMGAVDRRPSTYVLMAGTPHFIDWFLFARQPKSLEAYQQQLAPLDPINFVPKLAPTPVFFQFAANDEYVPVSVADKFYAAALPQKQTALYDAGHDLQTSEVMSDRITWLMRKLKLQH